MFVNQCHKYQEMKNEIISSVLKLQICTRDEEGDVEL